VPTAIADQLALRFRALQDVKFAGSRPEASLTARSYEPDIVVETWMNSRLYVYIIEKAPKARMLRAILKQNTKASIGSLFLIELALLPGHGYCGKLRDWQEALRALHRGAIYAFSRAADAEIRLLQINLDAGPERREFSVWHSVEFPLDAVSVRRREYHNTIRGRWYIGDIASPKFKRHINEQRARQRFHYQTRAAGGPPAPQINAAYLALEIEVGAGQPAVKAAFRRLAREYHPDVSRHEKAEAERRFKEIQAAYERIKAHRHWS